MTEITERLSTALADRYRLERHLGEGGMATVYLAHDLKHDRKVAVKVLKPELSAIIGGGRFVNEIKVTANLQHPNILPLFDSGEADGFLYYVMPFVEGESLRDKMTRERQSSVEDTVAIGKGVAAALQYAHDRGIVHRDIKPENILLQSGQPLVADFGIALAVSQAGGTRLTETGLSLGTPHYMSPEQAMGDRELDARSDLYSLGAMLYEMLVGEPPHVGNSVQAIIARILSEKPMPIGQSRDMVPTNVDAAIQRALAKSPADRFASAEDFGGALTNPNFTLPSAPMPAPVSAPPPSGGGRWDRLGPVAAGVAVVALALVGWMAFRPEPPTMVTRLSVYQPPEQDFAGSATFDVSRDGSLIVYEGPGEGRGSQLWVRRWDALTASPIRETEGATAPAVSPDGLEVAFARNGSLRVVPLQGGVSRTLAAGGVRCCARWSPDGQWVYFDHADVGVGRVPAAGGDPELLIAATEWSGTQVSIFMDPLPDGRTVVFEGTKASGGPWVMSLDVETGEHREITPGQFPRYASGHVLFTTPDGATLMAAPFDNGDAGLAAAPVPVGEGLRPASGGWNYFAVSATGRLVYGAGRRTPGVFDLVWLTRDGQAMEPDPEWTFDPGDNNRGLALSPDGNQVAVTVFEDGNYDVWIKQLPRGPASRLTFDPAQDVRPRWSPDGRMVTFLSDRGAQATSVYGSLATGTGGADLLLQHEQRPFWEAIFSPDGQWLLARSGGLSTVTGGRDVWALRVGEDSAPSELLTTDFDEKAIAVSPDGRWLAYESDETGRNEVYVRPFPNVTDGKWQVSTGGGVMPRWANSSQELFYVNAENEMVAATVRPGGAAFSVGDRRSLFTLPATVLFRQDEQYALYDVGPDDRRFMMMQVVERLQTPASRPELILVDGWVEGVRRQVAGR